MPDAKIQDATLNYLGAKLVDTVSTGTYINSLFLKGRKPWRGAQEEVPIMTSLNSTATSFVGASVLPTTIVQNTTKMTFDAKFVAQPSNLTSTDLALNDTEMQVADLMDRQVQSDAVSLMNKLASMLYSNGTGNGNLDITGIAAAIDDGTSVATYGNLSRTTYPSIDATVTSSGGTLTLAKMFTTWDTLQQDNEMSDLLLTTKAVRSLFEQLLLPNLRYASWNKMGVGADMKQGLVFREARVVGDSSATTGKLWFINEDTFVFRAMKKFPDAKPINYGLDEMEGTPSNVNPGGLGFFTTDWLRPVNQLTVNKFILVAGNLICENPRYNGVLTGITGI
jgi:hypothetical protein